ncbi:hypothetical protein LINPERHAP2_LOCUS37574 [Linum perenne]
MRMNLSAKSLRGFVSRSYPFTILIAWRWNESVTILGRR